MQNEQTTKTPAEAEQAAMERVERWDRAMQRTFKGIVSRPVRRAMLSRAVPDDA